MTQTPPPSSPPARTLWSLVGVVGLVWALSQGLQWWQTQRQAAGVAKVLQQHRVVAQDVVMYTTSTCPYCAQARQWLQANHVPFVECNIERSVSCSSEFERQGAPGVPLMQVRSQWRIGFDPEWLVLALQTQNTKPRTDTSPRP